MRQKYDNVIAELMLHTGMRPGEACRIRLAEIDRSGEVWLYRPSRHKTAHHGHARVIAIGPKAQFVQRRFIWVQCPHCGAAGRPEILGEDAQRLPGESFTPSALGHSIRVACKRHHLSLWHPNQPRCPLCLLPHLPGRASGHDSSTIAGGTSLHLTDKSNFCIPALYKIMPRFLSRQWKHGSTPN